MLKVCLVFWKSEPQYAYKRYAYKTKRYSQAPGIIKTVLNRSNKFRMTKQWAIAYYWYFRKPKHSNRGFIVKKAW